MREFVWIGSLLAAAVYFTRTYLLPLGGILPPFAIEFKFQLEIILCSVVLLTSFMLISTGVSPSKVEMVLRPNYIYARLDNRVVGIRGLELSALKGRTPDEFERAEKYDESFLRAIRDGMHQSVHVTFQAGVSNQTPYIRLFLSCKSNTTEDIEKILYREAARTEAILLATLDNAEIQTLRGTELVDAIFALARSTPLNHAREELVTLVSRGETGGDSKVILNDHGWSDSVGAGSAWQINGAPRSTPTLSSHQIGMFLSALLQQGIEASLTCTFSSAKPKREKRKLEGEWRRIRSREKSREDTLADHSMKEKLIDKYRAIQEDNAWFDVSVRLHLKEKDTSAPPVIEDCLKGIVQSIWGDSSNLELRPFKIGYSNELKLLFRRHSGPKRMHISDLITYVNIPKRSLPELSATISSEFQVPSKAIVSNEVFIGWSVYRGRKLGEVGLKLDWFREHVAILGATGTGKTTLVKQIMAQISTMTKIPWWIFDVKGSEYLELTRIQGNDVIVIRPGEDPNFTIDFLDTERGYDEQSIDSTFTILNELLRERGGSSELSPAMERLLLQSLRAMAQSPGDGSVTRLKEIISESKTDKHVSQLTKDALLNRLEILTRNPLGAILRGGPHAVKISQYMDKRVIFDLRYVARTGGMESARILYNLIAKRIFDSAMQRGITPGLQHVVVLEEASNLVPESYTRENAADITTGESMVMLQRATGQGVIVVSTRPNISSNILANTGTKIVFRLPYDSSVGARFLSLSEEQERYLRSMRTGIALIDTPVTETFEIATVKEITIKSEQLHQEEEPVSLESSEPAAECERTISSKPEFEEAAGGVIEEVGEEVFLHRTTDISRRVVALISSKGFLTNDQLRDALTIINPELSVEADDIIRELIALEVIEREALGIVDGGIIYTLPGRSEEIVTRIVTEFTRNRLVQAGFNEEDIHLENNQIFVDDVVILVATEKIRVSTLEERVSVFREYLQHIGTRFRQMTIILRGSVAAAKIRELVADDPLFEAVTIIPAFPNSIEKVVAELQTPESDGATIETDSNLETFRGADTELDFQTESSPSSFRMWIGLLEGYVEINGGSILWDDLMQFMETTVSQSHKRHSIPMNVEEGQRALSEMLIDERLFALRVTSNMEFISFTEGLWLVSPTRFQTLKSQALEALEKELRKHGRKVETGHSPFDICANDISYIVFPTKKVMNQVTDQRSEHVCQVCSSHQLVCILPAIEYVDEFEDMPDFMSVTSLDDGLVSVLEL